MKIYVPRDAAARALGADEVVNAITIEAQKRGLLHSDPTRLCATREGQLFLNDLLQYFLP